MRSELKKLDSFTLETSKNHGDSHMDIRNAESVELTEYTLTIIYP